MAGCCNTLFQAGQAGTLGGFFWPFPRVWYFPSASLLEVVVFLQQCLPLYCADSESLSNVIIVGSDAFHSTLQNVLSALPNRPRQMAR